MPKRPTQHQLEDLSRAKLGLLLPREWALRDKDKDYGIDVEVELFDASCEATGLVFLVQLKATESEDVSKIRDLDFSIDRLSYYDSLDLPVLICRYSHDEDIFYSKWSSEIDTYNCKKDAKTVRIKFTEQDVLNNKNTEGLVEHIKKLREIRRNLVNFPISLHLSTIPDYINSTPRGLFITKINGELNKYNQFITVSDNESTSLASVEIDNNGILIEFSKITKLFIKLSSNPKVSTYEELAKDVIFGLGVCLACLNMAEMAAKVFLLSEIENRIFDKQDLIINLIPSLIQTAHVKEIVSLLIKASDERGDNLVEAIVHMSLLSRSMAGRSEDHITAFQNILEHCLRKYTDLEAKEQVGIAHYNLANHMASKNLNKQALHHYALARKNNSMYYHQFYFYREVAGILFAFKKYRFASQFYKKAMELTSDELSEELEPLLADALMFSGQYRAALDLFNSYLSKAKDQTAEWHLKCICLEGLIDNTKIDSQTRNPKKAIEIIGGDLDNPEVLEKAIELDCLCGLAWFNSGIESGTSNENESAAFCFTMCGLVQNGDVEAWVNATLCSLNKEVPISMLALIFSVAHFFNRDDYIHELYRKVDEQVDGEALIAIHKVIEGLQDSIRPKSKNSASLMRIHDNGDKLKNAL